MFDFVKDNAFALHVPSTLLFWSLLGEAKNNTCVIETFGQKSIRIYKLSHVDNFI